MEQNAEQNAQENTALTGFTRRNLLHLLGGAALIAALTGGGTAAQAKPSDALYARCADACARSCAATCQAMVTA